MTSRRPKVTLALPVHNGENYLAYALESLLNQTYEDFELLIGDNASDDATQDICRDYAHRDSRIVYDRSAQNLGASFNFNRLVSLAQGQFFRWAAHDDICEPTLVARSVEILEAEPQVGLVYTRGVDIDAQGETILHHPALPGTCSDSAVERFTTLIDLAHPCFPVFGMMRTHILRQTDLLQNFSASDRVLQADLGLRGLIREVPEELFRRREHPMRSVRAYPKRRQRDAWFDPARAAQISLPLWRLLHRYRRVVANVPLSESDRTGCYAALAAWSVKNGLGLAKDVGTVPLQLWEGRQFFPKVFDDAAASTKSHPPTH